MKSITLKNEDGETIELKRGDGGSVLMRHSDVDATEFGMFRDRGDALAKLAAQGIDINTPEAKQIATLLDVFVGSHMELNRTRYILSAEEVAMIRQAINQLE